MAITKEYKERVALGLVAELQKMAQDANGRFPILVDEIVSTTVAVIGIKKFNSMLSMCTVGLELIFSEGKYFLIKKR